MTTPIKCYRCQELANSSYVQGYNDCLDIIRQSASDAFIHSEDEIANKIREVFKKALQSTKPPNQTECQHIISES